MIIIMTIIILIEKYKRDPCKYILCIAERYVVLVSMEIGVDRKCMSYVWRWRTGCTINILFLQPFLYCNCSLFFLLSFSFFHTLPFCFVVVLDPRFMLYYIPKANTSQLHSATMPARVERNSIRQHDLLLGFAFKPYKMKQRTRSLPLRPQNKRVDVYDL